MGILRTIIYALITIYVYFTWVLLTLTAALAAPLFLLASTAIFKKPLNRMVRLFNYYYGWIWTHTGGVFFSATCDFKKQNSTRPSIYVVNHNSMLDIIYLGRQPCKNFVLTARSWPFRLFGFRWFMQKADYFNMEALPWERSLALAESHLASGVSIIIFPEGTRKHNEPLGRFHSGAFHLAVKTGAPVVPLCIWGTRAIFPPGSWYIKPGIIKMKTLASVDPCEFGQDESAHLGLKKMIKSRMAEALEEMNAEGMRPSESMRLERV